MSEFAENIAFLKILNLIKTDKKVHEALVENDLDFIDVYPGLSRKERKFLKSINWDKIELSVSKEDIHNFGTFKKTDESTVCEQKVATEAIEKKCYKL